ncbi:hypothetical protein ACEZDB_22845 [Streptacidiphilus sp. N1-3]|uniref:SMI1/KNR4 family protein n=1 Tax=Streptacidiphilus alkalitolerans TaxID=3342712 RepID=A0ABV6X5A9_9ACTN
MHAFEAEHGIVVPEPYRTFVAEISDGSFAGPPDLGPSERCLAQPFPLAQLWIWEDDPRPDEEIGPLIARVTDHGSIVAET